MTHLKRAFLGAYFAAVTFSTTACGAIYLRSTMRRSALGGAVGTSLHSRPGQIWEHELIMRNHYKRLIGVRPRLDNALHGGRKLSQRSPANVRFRRGVIQQRLEYKREQEKRLNRLAKLALGTSMYKPPVPQNLRLPKRRKRVKRKMKVSQSYGNERGKPPISPRKPWNDSVYSIQKNSSSHRSNLDLNNDVKLRWEEIIQNPGAWQGLAGGDNEKGTRKVRRRKNSSNNRNDGPAQGYMSGFNDPPPSTETMEKQLRNQLFAIAEDAGADEHGKVPFLREKSAGDSAIANLEHENHRIGLPQWPLKDEDSYDESGSFDHSENAVGPSSPKSGRSRKSSSPLSSPKGFSPRSEKEIKQKLFNLPRPKGVQRPPAAAGPGRLKDKAHRTKIEEGENGDRSAINSRVSRVIAAPQKKAKLPNRPAAKDTKNSKASVSNRRRPRLVQTKSEKMATVAKAKEQKASYEQNVRLQVEVEREDKSVSPKRTRNDSTPGSPMSVAYSEDFDDEDNDQAKSFNPAVPTKEELEEAAIQIQKIQRAKQARKHIATKLKESKAALNIQKQARARAAKKKVLSLRNLKEEERQAALAIQKQMRAKAARERVEKMKANREARRLAEEEQKRFAAAERKRKMEEKEREKNLFEAEKEAALKRRREEEEEKKRQENAARIERAREKKMKSAEKKKLEKDAAVVKAAKMKQIEEGKKRIAQEKKQEDARRVQERNTPAEKERRRVEEERVYATMPSPTKSVAASDVYSDDDFETTMDGTNLPSSPAGRKSAPMEEKQKSPEEIQNKEFEQMLGEIRENESLNMSEAYSDDFMTESPINKIRGEKKGNISATKSDLNSTFEESSVDFGELDDDEFNVMLGGLNKSSNVGSGLSLRSEKVDSLPLRNKSPEGVEIDETVDQLGEALDLEPTYDNEFEFESAAPAGRVQKKLSPRR